jgi:hypothetical protein
MKSNSFIPIMLNLTMLTLNMLNVIYSKIDNYWLIFQFPKSTHHSFE